MSNKLRRPPAVLSRSHPVVRQGGCLRRNRSSFVGQLIYSHLLLQPSQSPSTRRTTMFVMKIPLEDGRSLDENLGSSSAFYLDQESWWSNVKCFNWMCSLELLLFLLRRPRLLACAISDLGNQEKGWMVQRGLRIGWQAVGWLKKNGCDSSSSSLSFTECLHSGCQCRDCC